MGNSVFGEAPQAGVVVLRAKNEYSIAYAVNKGIFLLPFQKGIQWSGGSAVFMKSPATPADSTLEPQEDDSPKESPVKYNPPYPDLIPKKKKAKDPVDKDALEAPAAYNPDPFPHKKNPDSKPGEGFTFTGPADGAMPEAERKRKLKNQQDYDEQYPASWPTGLEREDDEKEREKKYRGNYGHEE
ncbi:MAG: hypothetical protein KGI27_13335 [Thaumarchaeota archaeon]|nr:hypothetical protein [Nitrososphaerota archaeon]